jgi:hypothetical protein
MCELHEEIINVCACVAQIVDGTHRLRMFIYYRIYLANELWATGMSKASISAIKRQLPLPQWETFDKMNISICADASAPALSRYATGNETRVVLQNRSKMVLQNRSVMNDRFRRTADHL